MSSKIEVVNHIVSQMLPAGLIDCKKMFGEYGLYCDGKFFAVICDDKLFVKITNAGAAVCDCEKLPPYTGASLYYHFTDIDNSELLCKFVTATCSELPMPKPKKAKVK